jgi:hypothetical protein
LTIACAAPAGKRQDHRVLRGQHRGVVDHQVDRLHAGAQRGEQLLHLSRVGDIGLVVAVTPVIASGRPAGHADDGGTLVEEVARQQFTDTAAAAGDHDVLSVVLAHAGAPISPARAA